MHARYVAEPAEAIPKRCMCAVSVGENGTTLIDCHDFEAEIPKTAMLGLGVPALPQRRVGRAQKRAQVLPVSQQAPDLATLRSISCLLGLGEITKQHASNFDDLQNLLARLTADAPATPKPARYLPTTSHSFTPLYSTSFTAHAATQPPCGPLHPFPNPYLLAS
jgi:hypothetical protein